MFAFALSSAIAFIVFGTLFNILKNIKSDSFYDDCWLYWFFIAIASILWFIVLPILVVVFITYLLKLLVDKISEFILKKVKK